MKISRTLLSYAGALGLLSVSHVALGQTTAPAAPAPAAAAPAAAPAAAAPAAPATPAVEPAAAPAAATHVDASATMQPAPVALAPAPLPLVEPAPAAAPAEKTEAAVPNKLAIAKQGWLQFGALAQAWWVYDRADKLAESPAGSGKFVSSDNYFRIRRAQLFVKGAIIPDSVEFFILADLAKTLKTSPATVTGANGTTTTIGSYYGAQDSSPLLDFYLTAKSDYVDVSVGQWKSPVSREGVSSSAELLFAERAFSTRYFGDNYDLGLRAEKKFQYLKYSAQLLQGQTANTIDDNKQKDLALRLEFYPIDGIYVGGVALASVGQRETQASTREVLEVDAGYDKDGITLRGEMLWGWKGVDKPNTERVKSRGMTLSGGYTIAKTIQPVFRISDLNIDQTMNLKALPLVSKFNLATDQVRSYEFGLNYLIEGKHAKLMASYSYFDFDSFPGITLNPRHQVMLAAQVAY